MELGVISLSDIQADPATGRPFPYGQRLGEIISYATSPTGAAWTSSRSVSTTPWTSRCPHPPSSWPPSPVVLAASG